MKKTNSAVALFCSLFMGSATYAATITVSGVSTFDSRPAGVLGDWTHTYDLGSPDVQIQKIKIILNSSLFFDTASGAPGFLTFQDVGTISDGGTGFTAFSASGSGLDGGTSLTLTFSGFNPGETYTHTGDVDQNQTLLNCNGLSGVALGICVATNVARTTDGSLVSGSEFAGSTIEVTLGGASVAAPVTLTGTFQRQSANVATAAWRGTVNTVPEPATWMLSGSLLAGLAWIRRRR